MSVEERAERAAMRDMWRAAPEETARALGIATTDIADATCIGVGVAPVLQLNRVLALTEASDADLDAIRRFYDGPFQISIAPNASALVPRLEARGFTRGYAWQKFVRDASSPPEPRTDLRVDEVGPEKGDAFAKVVLEGFGMPPPMAPWLAKMPGRDGWHAFVAFDRDEPAAAGLVWTDRVEGLAWLGLAAARPSFRRRGGQRAILAARIAKAVSLGCTSLVTETGVPEPGKPSTSHANIEHAGFRKTYVRENWIAPKST
jgi:hypothetical protein